MSDPVLTFADASFSYGSTPVLEGVTGTVEPGEALALLGPNGAGKTTLLKAIVGMVKSTGMTINPAAVTKTAGAHPSDASSARPVIGYVPQSADLDLSFPVRVRDVVGMGLLSEYRKRVFSLSSPAKDPRVDDVLERVDLTHRAGDHFGALSGGQRQRVLIARALVASPQLVLFDEPFNGLDAPNRAQLLELMRGITSSGAAVVVSTHDLVIAEKVCDKALLLAGRQVAFGPVNEVMQPDVLAKAYGEDRHQEVAAAKR